MVVSVRYFILVRSAIVTTTKNFRYRYVFIREVEKSHLVFGVKACADALLSLRKDRDITDKVYEVVIGGFSNTRTVIR